PVGRATALRLVDHAVAVVVLAVARLGGGGPHRAGVVAADAARPVARRDGAAARSRIGNVVEPVHVGVVAGHHVAHALARAVDGEVGVAAVHGVGEPALGRALAAAVDVAVVVRVAEP